MYKIFVVVAFLAAANAAPADHQATSFSSYNNNHNSVYHIDSAPAPVKYAAPSYAAPTYVSKAAIPVYQSAPVYKYSAPAAPVAKYAIAAPAYAHHEEEYGPAQYEYAYAIEDPHTGDYHSQQEHRDGHNVVGQYSLHEADGTVRLVKYSADEHGFNAVVEKQGEPKAAPVYKKVVAVAAPNYHH